MSVNSGGPPFMLPPPRPPPPAAHMPQPPGHLMAGGVMPLGLPPGPAGAAAILVQMNKEHRLSNIPLIDSSLVQINKEHHLSSIPLTDSSLVQIKSEPSDLEFKPELNFNEHNEHDEHDNEHDHENQLIANGLAPNSSHEEIVNSEFGQVVRETAAPSGRTVLGIHVCSFVCLRVGSLLCLTNGIRIMLGIHIAQNNLNGFAFFVFQGYHVIF